jgi:hypothetical protein
MPALLDTVAGWASAAEMGAARIVSATQATLAIIRISTIETFVDQTVVGKTPERLRGSN